ncbi:DUF6234 family protein [Streptomyces sp. H27-C3]|uniref:DUF6234 family protein n=1 Tax=Streptomyces sp. H27-C3 TaxID=3046305 RepID=UPI0024B8EA3B|nr:DUF6234 family protein [Streptomyces sp. H27-C3]MDJ0466999.1 DUF6234 family protein [Streptomyces sp. H27-C3]
MSADTAPHRPAAGAHGWADPLTGLLLLVLDAAACVVAAFMLAMREWGRGAGAQDPKSPEPPEPPPVDWVPTVTVGAIALLAAAVGVALLCNNWPFAGSFQLVAALVICLAAVVLAREDYRERHPEPTPTSSYDPGVTGHQCLSGGDNSECQDSGG